MALDIGQDNKFDDYIQRCVTNGTLHPELTPIYDTMPTSLYKLKNIILYGPKGSGRYTQALSIINKYSDRKLKYEKKAQIVLPGTNMSKMPYIIKMSDIHYEIDMSMLGCNTKMVWHEIYTHVSDIIRAKTNSNRCGILLCTNFNNIQGDLIDIFYNYMYNNSIQCGGDAITIKFILITSNASFIPTNIFDCCQIIPIEKPTIVSYEQCNIHISDDNKDTITTTTNIKNIVNFNKTNVLSQMDKLHHKTCDAILVYIITPPKHFPFLQLRESLYSILVYNLDVHECVWYIITTLINNGHIPHAQISNIHTKLFSFFKLYNNNYRPIYHLESFVMYLIQSVNAL